MIDHLIKALSKELDLSAKEIADTIWLALQMQAPNRGSNIPSEPQEYPSATPLKNARELVPPKSQPPNPVKNLPVDSSEPKTEKVVIRPLNTPKTTEVPRIPFKVPNAPSVREPLTLARAFKPLRRGVPSGANLGLDEGATIQRIVDDRLWLPVFKSTIELWLDLELVVDESLSMQIWQPTIRELERLLKNYGVFRDIRVWGLMTDEHKQVQICRGIGSNAKKRAFHSPKELIDPTKRRLVLVVSDCVSSSWRNSIIVPVLQIWGNHLPTAIVQMLPKWLWHKTALGQALEVRLRNLTPGISNQYLIAQAVSLWDEIDSVKDVKVPIFTLEPNKVDSWAKMLSGKGSVWTGGYVFRQDLGLNNRVISLLNPFQGELTAQQRVQAFQVTASPIARKLAGLLSAAPIISLPVVRLIQETLLKDSLQVNVAEVFLGGLLKPLSDTNLDTDPDSVQYEFIEGVRDLLLDSVPSSYVLNVIDALSIYISKKAGLSIHNFVAFLEIIKNYKYQNGYVDKEIQYFATITSQVLKRSGGR